MRSSNFQLEKIYLDCIDAKGNCFIIYDATIKFFFLKLNYSALIFSNEDGIEELSYFKKNSTPVIKDELKFSNPKFQFSGRWVRTNAPIRLALYKDPKGRELLWNCHHPKSNTVIVFNNVSFSGYGYAETISLPFPPHQLPIDELRWGRFLSQHHTLIWIHWKGCHPLNKIFYDGELFEDGIFKENMIVFGNGQYNLKFDEAITLTKRKLSSLFNALPFLKIFFSKRFLNSEEHKYKAASTFTEPDGTSHEGFSLFEIVKWKK